MKVNTFLSHPKYIDPPFVRLKHLIYPLIVICPTFDRQISSYRCLFLNEYGGTFNFIKMAESSQMGRRRKVSQIRRRHQCHVLAHHVGR
jgi:hypothetical protein